MLSWGRKVVCRPCVVPDFNYSRSNCPDTNLTNKNLRTLENNHVSYKTISLAWDSPLCMGLTNQQEISPLRLGSLTLSHEFELCGNTTRAEAIIVCKCVARCDRLLIWWRYTEDPMKFMTPPLPRITRAASVYDCQHASQIVKVLVLQNSLWGRH